MRRVLYRTTKRKVGRWFSSWIELDHLIDSRQCLEESRPNPNDFCLEEQIVSVAEEEQLVQECRARLRRRRYEHNHWDDVIVGFKEMETTTWSPESQTILDKVRASSLLMDQNLMPQVHVIDLAPKTGLIKPHIDSVKFSGSIVAGLSLVSDAIMRFEHQTSYLDVLLPRRSLYRMSGDFRYRFTHAILKDQATFHGKSVPRHHRVSIIFRNPLE